MLSLLIAADSFLCETKSMTYFEEARRMTIAKMDLLCTIGSEESGGGGASSKSGSRVNLRGVFGSLMMMWLFLCSTLHAQTAQGSIAGTVKDAREALVQGAAVEVLNTATGVRQSTRTNSVGAFSVVSLNPGTYNVVVSKSGFEKSVTSAVTVSTAQLSTVDVILTVGSQITTVTVTAQDSLLSKDDSNVTTTVGHAVVESLPYPERSSLEATLLVYQLTSKTLVQGTYQGLKGTHLIGAFTGQFNTPTVSTIASAISSNQYLGLQIAPNAYGISQNGAVIKETNLQLLNPIQNFFNFPLTEIYPREGASAYNALYMSVNQRFGHGLSLLANYTWSKSIDDVPDTGTGANSGGFGTAAQQSPLTTAGEKAVASFDQPSRLKAGYTYQLPLGRGQTFDTHNGFLNQLLGNISTSGILTVESGVPNSVTLGSTGYFTSMTPTGTKGCVATGTTNGAPNKFCASAALPSSYTLRPNIVPGVPLINKNWKANAFNGNFTPYINPAAFMTPGTQGNPMLGNAPRTLSDGRTPRETMFDASVRKGFTFRERYKVSLVGTFINAFNHPVYYGLGTRTLQSSVTANLATGTLTPVANGSFGQLNAGNTSGFSRVIQVGGEFTF
jgi:hypothetical protein